MNTTPPPTSTDEDKPGLKALRVFLELFGACMALGIGLPLFSNRKQMPLWASGIGSAFVFVAGAMLIIHGRDCIRWRKPLARFWASVHGGRLFTKDPYGDALHRSVMGGILTILMGVVLILAVAKSLRG